MNETLVFDVEYDDANDSNDYADDDNHDDDEG